MGSLHLDWVVHYWREKHYHHCLLYKMILIYRLSFLEYEFSLNYQTIYQIVDQENWFQTSTKNKVKTIFFVLHTGIYYLYFFSIHAIKTIINIKNCMWRISFICKLFFIPYGKKKKRKSFNFFLSFNQLTR